MRTLFILCVITVAALGQKSNSCPKITKENLSSSLESLRSMYEEKLATVLQLRSYITTLRYDQDGQDPKITNEYISNSANILQSIYDNINTSSVRLYSYLMNLQNDRDYQDAKITENLSRSLRILQSMYNDVTEISVKLKSHLTNPPIVWSSQAQGPSYCDEAMKDRVSDIRTLSLFGKRIKILCDQSSMSGWVVFQRRQDGSVDFYRNWEQYEEGFGNLTGEFWLGLANLHHLTKYQNVKLRIDLMDFDGTRAYAIYNTFNISGPEDNYRLNVDGYRGTAGDTLWDINKMQFSTHDRDNDLDTKFNCAAKHQGAWWYRWCAASNLNGRYKPTLAGSFGYDGVTWHYWKERRSFKRVEMKIKKWTLN